MKPAGAIPLLLALASGCGDGSDDSSATPSGSTATTPSGSTFDRPGTAFGSLVLRQLDRTPNRTWEVELAGVFPLSDPGYLNAAECARLGAPCLSRLPSAEDDWLDYDPELLFQPDRYDYDYVGPIIELGPVAAFAANPTDGPSHYYGNSSTELGLEGVDGPLSLRLSGEWGSYEGVDDILVAPPMNPMSHQPGTEMVVHDGQVVVLEWEPRGRGDVVLRVEGQGVARVWKLEDDGYFELAIDDLGLGTFDVELEFSLARWQHAEVEVAGNLLDVLAIGEARWPGGYFYVDGRDELITSDACTGADALPPVGTGAYWGRLADLGFSNDLDPSYGGCTGSTALGEEGFVRFDLPPLTYLSITQNNFTDDPVLYLVDGCADTATCLDGSDNGYIGVEESVQYVNASDRTETVYAVFDGWRTATGVFLSDITVTPLSVPDVADTCPTALGQAVPSGPGFYYGTYTNFTDQLDPADSGCLPFSSPGPDAMTRVELDPGQTLYVNIDMQGSNPALYLVDNCSTTAACRAGSDFDLGPTEQLQYQNTSALTEELFLVVDSKVSIQPYFLTIDIQ